MCIAFVNIHAHAAAEPGNARSSIREEQKKTEDEAEEEEEEKKKKKQREAKKRGRTRETRSAERAQANEI